MDNSRILVTGAAGFIGATVMRELVSTYPEVVGIDSFSPYYSTVIKKSHLESSGLTQKVHWADVSEFEALREIYQQHKPSTVIHLAAQGGVRASQLDPEPYILSNQLGFLNLLKLNNEFSVQRFIYASSSSVYGDGLIPPFKEAMKLPAPKSLYALSKLSNELMAEHFPNIQNGKRLGLRFFTVYGPWGRPDMAVSRMLVSGLRKTSFNLTASLDLMRDFTFVDDVAFTISDLVKLKNVDLKSHDLYNVAGESPRSMKELIQICRSQGLEININNGRINNLDVALTHGSNSKLNSLGVHIPSISLEEGIGQTLQWMKSNTANEILKLLD